MMCIDVLGSLTPEKTEKLKSGLHPSISGALPFWRKGEPDDEMGHDMKAVRRALAFCVDALSKK